MRRMASVIWALVALLTSVSLILDQPGNPRLWLGLLLVIISVGLSVHSWMATGQAGGRAGTGETHAPR